MAADIRYSGMYDAALTALGINQNGSSPRCDHVDALRPVTPQSAGCRECLDSGASWLGLLVCLTCGWVACSNDSPQRHAHAHYQETDHPVAGGLEAGSAWRWCYVHSRVV
ncbi:MAG TPA: UBP-type zinc finger domain-containing protein [Streptosporangiaceae bacterium]|jgi:uncharacterized UBP type Zn finger protein